jgi:RimJ/RimL family protein N-acetyltransferase/2-polyprenyl-3-methyl-5-hydroxy-6-metoxy-1,4-benzoquinol methylase
MNEQSTTNKTAWEYRAYEFWVSRHGTPEENAKDLMENPFARLKKHKKYFEHAEGLRIAVICGSCGRRAIPLALLGAEVTVFDISEENKRYAYDTAKCANIPITYVIGDFYDVDREGYSEYFDMIYMEGGVLHYFKDINLFQKLLYTILKPGGTLIESDFHPARRLAGKGTYASGTAQSDKEWNEVNYFDSGLYYGDVAYKSFFGEKEQTDFPPVMVRRYNLSEIINSVLDSGFTMKRFEEHPDWVNENIPGEFTIVAEKQEERYTYLGRDGQTSIRFATVNDAIKLCSWWNDGKVMEHAGFPNGLGTNVKEIEELIQKEDENNHRLIIEIRNKPVGEMNFRIENNIAEIGIKICDFTYQEKGFGTKALKLLIDYLFSIKNVDKIILDTNLRNTRAQHVYEKLGFQKVRVNVNAWRDQLGVAQTSVDYELLKETE